MRSRNQLFMFLAKMTFKVLIGIILVQSYSFGGNIPHARELKGDDITYTIDLKRGLLRGIIDKRSGKRIVVGSYDFYFLEDKSDKWITDERHDKVNHYVIKDEKIVLRCTNPNIEGIIITKEYSIKEVNGEKRILSKRIQIDGKRDHTLMSISSLTLFDKNFREKSYYHRIFVTGTIVEDPRSTIPAKEVNSRIQQRAWFNSKEGRSQFLLINPELKLQLGQYLWKINDKWSYPQALNQSYWTPFGWEMGWAQTFLNGNSFSAEMRYHLVRSNDRLDFHREYMNMPEYVQLFKESPPNPLARKLRYANTAAALCNVVGKEEKHRYTDIEEKEIERQYSTLRSDEIMASNCSPKDEQWPYYPADDKEIFHYFGRDDWLIRLTNGLTGFDVKKWFKIVQKDYPRCYYYFYQFINDIYVNSIFYKENQKKLGSFILKDKTGKPVPGMYRPKQGYMRANWSPEYRKFILKRILRQVDYYDMKIVYLDFGPGSIIVDWESERVVQMPDFLKFLQELHQELRKRGKMLWLNAFTGQPYYDIGYFECSGAHHGQWGNDWRSKSEVDLMRKLYTPMGALTIPMYWDKRNHREYLNHVFGLCLSPMMPQGKKGQLHWNTYASAAFEIKDAQLVEIGLEPCWWRDYQTQTEAYSLKQGDTYILTVVNHYSEKKDIRLRLDPELMSLNPEKDIFVWYFYPQNFDTASTSAPPSDFQELIEKINVIKVERRGLEKIILKKMKPETIRIVAITQVPAVIYSVEGQRTHFLLPETLGCKVEGKINNKKKNVLLNVSADKRFELLVWAPEEWGDIEISKNGENIPSVDYLEYGGNRWVKIFLPEGKYKVGVKGQ